MYGYPRPSIPIQLATQARDNQVILYIIIFLSVKLIVINFTRWDFNPQNSYPILIKVSEVLPQSYKKRRKNWPEKGSYRESAARKLEQFLQSPREYDYWTFTNSQCFISKCAIFIRMQDIQLPFLQLKANNSKS